MYLNIYLSGIYSLPSALRIRPLESYRIIAGIVQVCLYMSHCYTFCISMSIPYFV